MKSRIKKSKCRRQNYGSLNNPVRIQFTNGNVTKYIYSAAGEKLRVIYQTAVPNIFVAIGSTRELTPSETLYTDSIDYRLGGALTLRNGRIDKYQFDEGYCQVSSSTSTTDTFILFYYEKDHLGNIRKVRKANRTRNGEVVQASNYYPFGAELCDGNADNSVQSRKYNGKEFDRMHGLNTYDYGARQYNPVTARWDRVDPLAHEYYGVSPYTYCMNNPVRFIDPDGREVKLHKRGKSYKTVGILGMIGGSLMMAGATLYFFATDGVGAAAGGGQLFSVGYATFKAGFATYGTGVTIDAYESINEPEPIDISSSIQLSGKRLDSGKNERHGDGGRYKKKTSTTNQILELKEKIKNAKSKNERKKLEQKIRNIRRNAESKEKGEEHSRGPKR